MASKLRRAPLFSYSDSGNGVCLHAYPQYPVSTSSCSPNSKKSLNHHNSLHHNQLQQQSSSGMECGVAYPTTNGTTSSGGAVGGGGGGGGIMTAGGAERSPARAGLHVAFTEKGEVKERREKFLTAKYGSHQMSLIRKRLAVEMWLYDELQKLYEPVVEGTKTREVEVDIDELLDMDNDDQRRRHLQELLVDAKKSSNDVKKFINDLLAKAKTL